MDEGLNILGIYQNSSDNRINSFAKRVKSSMLVDLHYDKVEANFEWLDLMEDTVRYLDNILRNPNRFIINEDEVVKVELAKHVTVESIKHLARNTNLIQDIDEKTGDVKPSKILNINKEESFDTYENRFIYTLIVNMETFLNFKKKLLLESSHLKDDKAIEYKGASMVGNENVTIELTMKSSVHTRKNDGKKNGEDLATRLRKMGERIVDLKSTPVFKDLARRHVALIRPPIKKTNVILKNTNFQYAMVLWNYLQEHFGDEDKRDKQDKNYEDEGELRGLFDDTFLLSYLAMCTLNKEDYDINQAKEKVISQVIRRVIDLNSTLSENEIKDLVGEQFAIVKNKSAATQEGIEKVIKKHVEKYFTKVNAIKLN